MNSPSPVELPGFVKAADIRRRAAEALRPPRRVTVSEAAERHRRLNNPGAYVGPWQNAMAPFWIEPMDLMTSRQVEEITIVAPAQTGKTEVGLNVVGHGIKYRPLNILLIQPTQALAADFADRRIDADLLRHSPDYAGELGGTRGDDKTFTKSFRNGLMLTIAWAVAGQLASRPVPIVIIDERDRMPNDLNREGSPKELARNRKKTFGRNGKLLEISSPSKTDGTGIMASYGEGDQNLWHWPCPDCGDYWTPGFDVDRKPTLGQLHLPEGCSPDSARDLARLACPHCGALQGEERKAWMNARGLWLPRGMTVAADGTLSGARPLTRRRSYWLSGLVSPFMAWGEIAESWLKAEQHYERTGDEGPLRVFYNTMLGAPYHARHGNAAPLEEHELARRCESYRLGTVPAGVRYLTAAVDIQGRAFDVLVEGWNEHHESWVVDRFDIRQLADGRTDIRPGECPEHWDELVTRVIEARYPLAGDPQRTLAVALTAIDSAGIPGVTDNAVRFYQRLRRRYKRALLRQVMLTKGAAEPKAPMLKPAVPIELDRQGKRVKTGVPLYVIGVHELKNTLDNRLRRETPGPLYKHFPADPPAGFFAELTAEERDEKGRWQRKDKGPNESWDLAVLNAVAAMRLRPERVRNWASPPSWAATIEAAKPAEEPATATATTATAAVETSVAAGTPPSAAQDAQSGRENVIRLPRRRPFGRSFGGW